MPEESKKRPTSVALNQSSANKNVFCINEDDKGKSKRTTGEVRAMYEKFPYPSPTVGKGVIRDNGNMLSVLFPGEDFAGKRVLDAGCGTGQRANGVAKMFPKALVTGVDMTSASLEVAREMAMKNGIQNIEFQQCDLLKLDLGIKFDVIISSGVIHHLEDPAKGLQNLRSHLTDSGLAMIWLYHSLGEYERFLGRELLHRLWGGDKSNLDRGASLMDALNLDLGSHQYGSVSGQVDKEISYRSINADAYMHPIVEAYRLSMGLSMLLNAGYDWASVASLNLIGKSVLVDVEGIIDPIYSEICLQLSDLFDDFDLQSSYLELDHLEKLHVIELILKPTAFTMIAGSSNAFSQLPTWLQKSAFHKDSLEVLEKCKSLNVSIIK